VQRGWAWVHASAAWLSMSTWVSTRVKRGWGYPHQFFWKFEKTLKIVGAVRIESKILSSKTVPFPPDKSAQSLPPISAANITPLPKMSPRIVVA
jgi:hypothetical protein